MGSSTLNVGIYIIAAIVAAIVIFGLLPRLLSNALKKMPNRQKSTIFFALDLLGIVIVIGIVLYGLSQLDDNAQLIAILITVASGAFIFTSEGWLQDAFSGIGLQFNSFYQIDDLVTLAGNRGRVIRVGLFRTQLETLELDVVSVRNSVVLQDNVINHSGIKFREISIIIHTAGYGDYEDDIYSYVADVQKIAERVQRDVCPEAEVESDLFPHTYFLEFGSSSDFVTVIFYSYDEDNAYRDASSAMHMAMAAELRPKGVVLGQVNANTIDNVLEYRKVD